MAQFAAIATLCLFATYDTFDRERAVLINLPRLCIWVLQHMPIVIIKSWKASFYPIRRVFAGRIGTV